jgi:hypothetical protein
MQKQLICHKTEPQEEARERSVSDELIKTLKKLTL